MYLCVSQKHSYPGSYLDLLGGARCHPLKSGLLSLGTIAFHCLQRLLMPAAMPGFLFPVASELLNRVSFLLIGCGLAFGTQINAC